MARPRRKSPDELMQEAVWSLYDICRLFRKGPKTIMQYVNHPDPKKRLSGYLINGEFCAEKSKVLAYFKYGPKNDRPDDEFINDNLTTTSERRS